MNVEEAMLVAGIAERDHLAHAAFAPLAVQCAEIMKIDVVRRHLHQLTVKVGDRWNHLADIAVRHPVARIGEDLIERVEEHAVARILEPPRSEERLEGKEMV